MLVGACFYAHWGSSVKGALVLRPCGGWRPVNKEATWGRRRAVTGPGEQVLPEARPGEGPGGRPAESAAGARRRRLPASRAHRSLPWLPGVWPPEGVPAQSPRPCRPGLSLPSVTAADRPRAPALERARGSAWPALLLQAAVLRVPDIFCSRASCPGHRNPTSTTRLGIPRLAGISSGSRQSWHWLPHSAPWPCQPFEAHAVLPVWGGRCQGPSPTIVLKRPQVHLLPHGGAPRQCHTGAAPQRTLLAALLMWGQDLNCSQLPAGQSCRDLR
ncbi:PREDICTED: uncharacterized protein LOC108544331 [Rhinopithecus bieti]|uniref:uncharacterized protein LOC108544331 n=1 Tax=Rhinopithecus bieti TaxID=61621 RepID=UPI00083C1A6E|nr:PREDICTED: uncharacterized protein LOC108544331 [Rhinopithecus bieti]